MTNILNNYLILRLLGAICLRSPFGFRDHRMIQLALNTGLRVSELSHLDIHHVLGRTVLALPAELAKMGSARLIPLNAVARRVIEELLEFNRSRGLSVDPSAPLLQGRHRQRLAIREIQRLLKHYREELAAPGRQSHAPYVAAQVRDGYRPGHERARRARIARAREHAHHAALPAPWPG